MDVDGNHMVDYHEFVMGTLEDKQLLTEAKLRAAFDFFDKDRNGYIDIGEPADSEINKIWMLQKSHQADSVRTGGLCSEICQKHRQAVSSHSQA